MGTRLDWHGREVRRLIEAAATQGIREGIKQIREESQRRVPVQTGELKRSMRHETRDMRGRITYSDSKAAAAHENLHVRYRTYRQPQASAKYLESAANDKRDAVLRAVAEKIRRAL